MYNSNEVTVGNCVFQGFGCMYKNGHMSSHAALENCKLESPWDLEDLVQAGRAVKSCPYFASRDLVDAADIVFCPYVYLIDPKIRNAVRTRLAVRKPFCVIYYFGLSENVQI
jgi:hypothetical protein